MVDMIAQLINYFGAFFFSLAYISILFRLLKDKSAAGLSYQSLVALMVSEVNNIILEMIFILVYKYDSSEYIPFYICDCISTIISIITIIYINISTTFKCTYDKNRDIFGLSFMKYIFNENISNKYYYIFLYIITLIISLPIVYIRRSNIHILLSLYEVYDDVLLSLALLPQLYMFYTKRPRLVSVVLANWVVCITMARLCSFIYWISTFAVKDKHPPLSRGVHIFTEFLNLAILADFIYYYFSSKKNQKGEFLIPI
eukprot:GHVL01027683.1.p1 GENE.GHVL01027683.1~~GHVL01027683.1.p1  ORF type:complete len:257 (-),score=51.92 GHVL01027683.1:241-1011(-)